MSKSWFDETLFKVGAYEITGKIFLFALAAIVGLFILISIAVCFYFNWKQSNKVEVKDTQDTENELEKSSTNNPRVKETGTNRKLSQVEIQRYN